MIVPHETFDQWLEEKSNRDFIEHYNIDLFAARRIWDAAKVSSMHEIMGLVLDGTLIMKDPGDISQPQ
jgi:hypothetical protein